MNYIKIIKSQKTKYLTNLVYIIFLGITDRFASRIKLPNPSRNPNSSPLLTFMDITATSWQAFETLLYVSIKQ